MEICQYCGYGEYDNEAFARHLRDEHGCSLTEYRVKRLGLCARLGCENAPLSGFTCCSRRCALETGEDLPLGGPASYGADRPARTAGRDIGWGDSPIRDMIERDRERASRQRNGCALVMLAASLVCWLIAAGGCTDNRSDPAEPDSPEPIGWRLVRTLEGHTHQVRGVAFSPDGRTLASVNQGNDVKTDSVHLWSVADGSLQRTIHANDWLDSVAFSPDGRRVAAGGEGRRIHLWSISDSSQLGRWPSSSGIRSLAFAPDGTLLSANRDGTISMLYDHTSTEALSQIEVANSLWSIAVSQDGRFRAVGTDDGWVGLFESRQPMRKFEGHRGHVLCLAFSSDGRIVATGGRDGSIRFWSTEDGRELAHMQGNGVVYCLAFSPDGRTLASGGTGGVRVWSVPDGRRLQTLRGHDSAVFGLAFSPDGRILATADKTIHLWSTH